MKNLLMISFVVALIALPNKAYASHVSKDPKLVNSGRPRISPDSPQPFAPKSWTMQVREAKEEHAIAMMQSRSQKRQLSKQAEIQEINLSTQKKQAKMKDIETAQKLKAMLAQEKEF